jgi:outer membrane protein OmpA-like peptidoglycan-associated protein
MRLKQSIVFFLFFTLTTFGQGQLEVFFDFNKDTPNDESLEKLALWIKDNKTVEVTRILGYCDSVDTNNYNKRLAERRIDAVLYVLINNQIGVNANLEKVAVGKEFNQSKVQAENRKVVVFYSVSKPNQEILTTGLAEQIKNAKVGETVKLPNIYFFNNSAKIVPKSKPTLYELLCAMQDFPNLKIEIQGHICCQINKDVNDVSTARAKAIYTFLILNKIDRKRMKFKGYGVTKPVHKIPEKSGQEEDDNRRVEILILEN